MTRTTMRALTGASLLTMMTTSVIAQERRAAVPALVREAQELLIAAYPELREGRWSWRITPTESGVAVEARPHTSPFEELAGAPLVAAVVLADEQGRFQELRADGALIAAARQRGRDPDARGRFSPDDPAAVESLIPEGLQARLRAPILRARSLTGASAQTETPTWEVDLESTDPIPLRFSLSFEPVEGRLLSVVRR